MIYFIVALLGFFLSRLMWRAFQGTCASRGVSEYRGAMVLLAWIGVLVVGGFICLVVLAAYLSNHPVQFR